MRLAEADRDADRTRQYLYQPEVRRFAAGLALKRGDRAGAETRLQKALTGARAMEARLFELRAARDLALLWAEEGERRRAVDILSPIYGWFIEGFDTADLRDAKALLDELS